MKKKILVIVGITVALLSLWFLAPSGLSIASIKKSNMLYDKK